jgi:hypothetical protein
VVLFGGFALPVHGVERSTLDIDLLICEEDVDAFAALAAKAGYDEILRTPHYAKFRHRLPEVLDIDTVFVDRKTIERIWADGSEEAVFGGPLRCASLDMMLGTKLHAIRYNKANRGRRDFDDVVELLATNDLDPRGERFVQLCGRYGTNDILERICKAMTARG